MPKTKIVLVYGGKSTEHEISCRSAAFIIENLNKDKYDLEVIGVDKVGKWLPPQKWELSSQENRLASLEIDQESNAGCDLPATKSFLSNNGDVVFFPMIHGTNGEDGRLQGLLELAQIPFVGAGTLGSAIGMDKVVAKKLVRDAGIDVVPWRDIRSESFSDSKARKDFLDEAIATLGFPIFVKPASLGSSVGISMVKSAEDLIPACERAFEVDLKIILEKGLQAREIECAALGGHDPEISLPGEVNANTDFYSYESKYIDENGADIQVPANLSKQQQAKAQDLSRCIFNTLELYGHARIDLFLEKNSGTFYFNEVNTIPGMTSISQFPILWKASGIDSDQLLDKMIALALKRDRREKNIRRQFA